MTTKKVSLRVKCVQHKFYFDESLTVRKEKENTKKCDIFLKKDLECIFL
jgi:hypothetical protein